MIHGRPFKVSRTCFDHYFDRAAVNDLDFLGTHLSNSQRVALDEAAQFAEIQSSKPLGAKWFNNHQA